MVIGTAYRHQRAKAQRAGASKKAKDAPRRRCETCRETQNSLIEAENSQPLAAGRQGVRA